MKFKKKNLLLSSILFVLMAIASISWRYTNSTESAHKTSYSKEKTATAAFSIDSTFNNFYTHLQSIAPTLNRLVLKQAYIGYLNLREQGKTQSPLLTIADLSMHSREPRLWIIDTERDTVLLNTYVSHGRGSGLAEAKRFSNQPNSNQSSLGFYLTGETYHGKHGRSLRLDGLDKGFNSNARTRAIVMHGAWYVGPQILSHQNRMGVSLGCPAVPENLKDQIIDLIKDKSVLYIYGQSNSYHSAWLNEEIASRGLMALKTTESDEQVM